MRRGFAEQIGNTPVGDLRAAGIEIARGELGVTLHLVVAALAQPGRDAARLERQHQIDRVVAPGRGVDRGAAPR